MSNTQINKILSFVVFLGMFILSFLLFYIVRKAVNEYNLEGLNTTWIYILICSMLLFTLLLFILNLNLHRAIIFINKSSHIDTINGTKEDEINKKEENKEDTKEDNNHKINLEKSSEKLLPKKLAADTIESYAEKILINLSKEINIVQGLFYIKETKSNTYKVTATYAYYSIEEPRSFQLGEGLTGQVAKSKELLNIQNVPDDYISVLSGLGEGSPNNIIIIPIIYNSDCIAIAEVAIFKPIDKYIEEILEKAATLWGENIIKFNTKN